MFLLFGVMGFGFPEVHSCLAFALISSTFALMSPLCFISTWYIFVNAQEVLKVFSNFFSALFRNSSKSVKINHIQSQ